ncbi:hypothetical protein [Arthrobacter sp. NicSoilC12]|uniref:hypothetical protein n=1 Tax=Arthrobacter sp. NicSoilC12 TaxID=2831001 RepID=UPI001CC4FE1D|nr:hypothetical protein [Arthrobacter sp. NicSoilC12]
MTLSPLAKGMATGTLGDVPLTSDVYAQIPWTQGICDEPLARVRFDDGDEVLGLEDARVVRDFSEHPEVELPQLILTGAAS